jgi:hypothetical protein
MGRIGDARCDCGATSPSAVGVRIDDHIVNWRSQIDAVHGGQSKCIGTETFLHRHGSVPQSRRPPSASSRTLSSLNCTGVYGAVILMVHTQWGIRPSRTVGLVRKFARAGSELAGQRLVGSFKSQT